MEDDEMLDIELEEVWQIQRTKSNARKPGNRAKKKYGPPSSRTGKYNDNASSKHGRSLSMSRNRRGGGGDDNNNNEDDRSRRTNQMKSMNRPMSTGRIGRLGGGGRKEGDDRFRNRKDHGGGSRSRGGSRAGSRSGSRSRHDVMKERRHHSEKLPNSRNNEGKKVSISKFVEKIQLQKKPPRPQQRDRSNSNYEQNDRFNTIHLASNSFGDDNESYDEENYGRKKKGLFRRFRRGKKENFDYRDDQSSSSSGSSGSDDESSEGRGGFFALFR